MTYVIIKICSLINDYCRTVQTFDFVLERFVFSPLKCQTNVRLVSLYSYFGFYLQTLQAFPPLMQRLSDRHYSPDVFFFTVAYYSFHITSHSEIYFPFSFPKPIYYFPLQKINIISSFKHWNLKLSQLRCFTLKKEKIHQRRADPCDCMGVRLFTGSDYGRCSG